MKKAIFGIITFLLLASYCQAQDSTAIGYNLNDSTAIYASNSLLSFKVPKDSFWYENRIDTIKTDFVIIVDTNNFVKKVRCDFIIHKYEQEQHSDYGYYVWENRNRNDTFYMNNNQVEVLLYRRKGDYGSLMVGNVQ